MYLNPSRSHHNMSHSILLEYQPMHAYVCIGSLDKYRIHILIKFISSMRLCIIVFHYCFCLVLLGISGNNKINMSKSLIFMSYDREPNTDLFVKKLKCDLDNTGFKYVCLYVFISKI